MINSILYNSYRCDVNIKLILLITKWLIKDDNIAILEFVSLVLIISSDIIKDLESADFSIYYIS